MYISILYTSTFAHVSIHVHVYMYNRYTYIHVHVDNAHPRHDAQYSVCTLYIVLMYNNETHSRDDGVLAGHHFVLATHNPPGLVYIVFQQSIVEHASIMNIHITLLIYRHM